MSEDSLKKIERLLETVAKQTADNAGAIERLEVQVAKNAVTMAEQFADVKSELREVKYIIDQTPDVVDKTYGSTINDILDRLNKLEAQSSKA